MEPYRPIYFELEELVCKDVFDFYGQTAWQFFDPRILITIDYLREKINKAIFVNNWKDGGQFTQRGFRCLKCQLNHDATINNKMYCSPHSRGMAIDCDIQGILAEESRQWVIKNKDRLPYPVRLENNVSWLHIDCVQVNNSDKVFLFNP